MMPDARVGPHRNNGAAGCVPFPTPQHAHAALDKQRRAKERHVMAARLLRNQVKKSKAAQKKISCARQYFLLHRRIREHTSDFDCSDHG